MSRKHTWLPSLIAIGLIVSHCSLATAAVVDSIDDFQDGSVHDWSHAAISPNPPTNEADVGLTGIGDNALRVHSHGGGGPGSRWIAFNAESDWTGDYIAAGINRIEADVNNIGPNTLNLRVAIGTGASPLPGISAAVTDAVTIAPGSGWVKVTWSLDPNDLISLGQDPATALTSVRVLRILDNPFPAYVASPTTGEATALLDNIVARGTTAIPEPGSVGVLAIVAAGLVCRRRRK